MTLSPEEKASRKRRKRTSKNVPAKGRLRDMADQLWARAVKADWNHRCAACGAGKCDAHHLIPRQHQETRYVLQNGIALCATHHQFDPDLSPHQNAPGFVLWLETQHPELAEWVFQTLGNGSHKRFDGTTNATYYIAVIRNLQQYVEEEDYLRIVGKKFSQYLEDQESD